MSEILELLKSTSVAVKFLKREHLWSTWVMEQYEQYEAVLSRVVVKDSEVRAFADRVHVNDRVVVFDALIWLDSGIYRVIHEPRKSWIAKVDKTESLQIRIEANVSDTDDWDFFGDSRLSLCLVLPEGLRRSDDSTEWSVELNPPLTQLSALDALHCVERFMGWPLTETH